MSNDKHKLQNNGNLPASGRDAEMQKDDKEFVDVLLRQQFGEDVPPEAEARMQTRLDEFRSRLDAREAREKSRSAAGFAGWFFGGRRVLAAVAMGAVGVVVAGIIVNESLIQPSDERESVQLRASHMADADAGNEFIGINKQASSPSPQPESASLELDLARREPAPESGKKEGEMMLTSPDVSGQVRWKFEDKTAAAVGEQTGSRSNDLFERQAGDVLADSSQVDEIAAGRPTQAQSRGMATFNLSRESNSDASLPEAPAPVLGALRADGQVASTPQAPASEVRGRNSEVVGASSPYRADSWGTNYYYYSDSDVPVVSKVDDWRENGGEDKPAKPAARSLGTALAISKSPATAPAKVSQSNVMTSRFAQDSEGVTLGFTTEQSTEQSAPTQPLYSNFSIDDARLQSVELEAPSSQETYDRIHENPFVTVQAEPLSTISIDVDTASYTNIRRMLSQGHMPPPDAVRIEEMINYFDYDYAPPQEGGHPFAVHTEVAACPWTSANRLMKIGIKGYEIPNEQRPNTNLVFLIDVSGSMNPANKLPLVKQSLTLLVNELDERDKVAIVVYAGASGLVLPSTPGNQKQTILDALENLKSGGSTNGGAGIELAYSIALENFIKDGVNRVILCTDGDFNVGTTDRAALVGMLEDRAKKGVFLTILGFGMGNLKDASMEELSNKGNGNYAYIDTLDEGRKVLVEQIGGTLFTIAKDVKIQIEFNVMQVKEYRLIGYENRVMAAEDFNDDTKDAGEIGAGHTVTAIYEIVPGVAQPDGKVNELKYQKTTEPTQAAFTGEVCTVNIRYKKPDGDTSTLLDMPVRDSGLTLDQASEDFHFAAAVASFGMILRQSRHAGSFTLADVKELATKGLADDVYGYRRGFLTLIDQAAALKKQP